MKKINPGTGRLNTPVQQVKNKGAKLLPGRAALNELQKGNPWQRGVTNYAKLTPSGRNAPMTYQDILEMAENATKVR